MKKKIYCFNNGGSPGWLEAIAIAEDGTILGGHICSHECFMKHDLGITSTWKHEHYNKHYGEGNWELEWIDNPKEHEGLKKAFELNAINEPPVNEEAMPKIEITYSEEDK